MQKTHIYLQRSVPIQPKSSNILPKFCRSAVVSPTGNAGSGARSSRSSSVDFDCVALECGAAPAVGANVTTRRLRRLVVESVRGSWLDRANLTGLVLGCIEAKFCKKICA